MATVSTKAKASKAAGTSTAASKGRKRVTSANSVEVVRPAAEVVEVATPAKAVNLPAMRAAILRMAAKISEHSDRDMLPAGSHYAGLVTLAAELDGVSYEETFDCSMNIGHDGVRASSTAAPQQDVIAWILGHVNAATRASILDKLPGVYVENSGTLPVSEKDSADAEAMLKRLRAQKPQNVRGSVSVRAEPVKGGGQFSVG